MLFLIQYFLLMHTVNKLLSNDDNLDIKNNNYTNKKYIRYITVFAIIFGLALGIIYLLLLS